LFSKKCQCLVVKKTPTNNKNEQTKKQQQKNKSNKQLYCLRMDDVAVNNNAELVVGACLGAA
jgi:hypothetical protein